MFLISGYESDLDIKCGLKQAVKHIKIKTRTMNMVELSSVLNYVKVFEYFVKDLNMKHIRDFNTDKNNLMA